MLQFEAIATKSNNCCFSPCYSSTSGFLLLFQKMLKTNPKKEQLSWEMAGKEKQLYVLVIILLLLCELIYKFLYKQVAIYSLIPIEENS